MLSFWIKDLFRPVWDALVFLALLAYMTAFLVLPIITYLRNLVDVRSALALTALALVGLDTPLSAHPGGLDASGCHHNRKTGDYHCHRGGGSPPPPPRRAQPLMGGGDVYYPNCAAARAAGAAPIRRGEAGYRPGLDRDGDGVACE